MRKVEQSAGPGAAEYSGSGHAKDEGGAGVVAKGQHTLRLALRAAAAPVDIRNSRRAEGIAARNAYDKGRRALAGDVKKPRGQRPGETPQERRKP